VNQDEPEYLAPGVYIEEIPFDSHPIPGVSTTSERGPLVLPAKTWTELRKIAGCIRRRRTGCRVLFTEPNRRAKLFAARALALELRIPLYRIDLAEIVSKSIGETENNLSSLLEAAEGGGPILLFDEADALFGKRSR